MTCPDCEKYLFMIEELKKMVNELEKENRGLKKIIGEKR
jgi:hypothetical protein